MRSSFKLFQAQASQSIPSLDLLQEQFSQLKAYILDKSFPEQYEEFQRLRDQIREVELLETNLLKRLARVK